MAGLHLHCLSWGHGIPYISGTRLFRPTPIKRTDSLMDRDLDLLGDLVARAKRAGADAADAVMIEGIHLSHSQRLGVVEKLERSEHREIGLRAFVGKRVAAVSSTDETGGALDELVAAATGQGCSWNGRPARVSTVSRLADAALSFTSAANLDRLQPRAWAHLQQTTRVQRGWGDCYGHCLVATGRADIMLDPILSPWDCAALLPILREAGGTFTDWTGLPAIDGGNGISTNGLLFDQVMASVRGEH